MAGMYCMKDLLGLLLREGGEELRLSAGTAPAIVTAGRSREIGLPGLTSGELKILLDSICTEAQGEELRRCGDVRFNLVQNSARFGITASRSSGAFSVLVRNLCG